MNDTLVVASGTKVSIGEQIKDFDLFHEKHSTKSFGETSQYHSLIDGRLVFWKDGSNGMDFKIVDTLSVGKVDLCGPSSSSERVLHRSLRFLVFSPARDL